MFWRDLFVILCMFGLAWLIGAQYMNSEDYQYNVTYEYGVGYVEQLPPIADKNPFLYFIYKHDLIITIFLISCAIFLADWKNIRRLLKVTK